MRSSPRLEAGRDPVLIEFAGKTVIVAGAARGIGRAIAVAFAHRGAEVHACDILVDECGERRGRHDLAGLGRRDRCPFGRGRRRRGRGGRGRGRRPRLCGGRRARAVEAPARGASDYASWITGQILPVMGSPVGFEGIGGSHDRTEAARTLAVAGRALAQAHQPGPRRGSKLPGGGWWCPSLSAWRPKPTFSPDAMFGFAARNGPARRGNRVVRVSGH